MEREVRASLKRNGRDDFFDRQLSSYCRLLATADSFREVLRAEFSTRLLSAAAVDDPAASPELATLLEDVEAEGDVSEVWCAAAALQCARLCAAFVSLSRLLGDCVAARPRPWRAHSIDFQV